MPSAPPRHDVTTLLLAWGAGDDGALDTLMPLVYQELRRLARGRMRAEAPGHVLQTTALIHEAYLRLIDASRVHCQNRDHFFALASRVMRRVLVDDARARRARKRGGDELRVPFDDALDVVHHGSAALVALDDALTALEQVDPRRARVVELRYFGGFSAEETAQALHVSTDTVTRDWTRARLWLLMEMSGRPRTA